MIVPKLTLDMIIEKGTKNHLAIPPKVIFSKEVDFENLIQVKKVS